MKSQYIIVPTRGQVQTLHSSVIVGVEVMFGGWVEGRVVELRAGADRSEQRVRVGVVSKISAVLPHRDGGAPEIEVVRGLRLRGQGERAGERNAAKRPVRSFSTSSPRPFQKRPLKPAYRASPMCRKDTDRRNSVRNFERVDARVGSSASLSDPHTSCEMERFWALGHFNLAKCTALVSVVAGSRRQCENGTRGAHGSRLEYAAGGGSAARHGVEGADEAGAARNGASQPRQA